MQIDYGDLEFLLDMAYSHVDQMIAYGNTTALQMRKDVKRTYLLMQKLGYEKRAERLRVLYERWASRNLMNGKRL